MPETAIIPTGIAALDHNCWELAHQDTGRSADLDGDGERHFDSRAAAEAWASDGMREFRLKSRELDGPCWTVTALCGWQLDKNVPMVMHHATPEEALRAAIDSEMTPAPAGGLICSPNCDDCREEAVNAVLGQRLGVTGSSPSGGIQ